MIFVMPDKVSDEKIKALRAFGAKVVTTPTAVSPDDPRSYYSVAKRIAAQTPSSFFANQYHNQSNPEAHYRTTGPEIWEQTEIGRASCRERGAIAAIVPSVTQLPIRI